MAKSVTVAVSAATVTLAHTAKGGGLYPNSVVVHSLAANAQNVFVGDINVSAAVGFPLTPGTSIALDVAPGEKTYVFSAATADVRILTISD
jgi:hypothetical protein